MYRVGYESYLAHHCDYIIHQKPSFGEMNVCNNYQKCLINKNFKIMSKKVNLNQGPFSKLNGLFPGNTVFAILTSQLDKDHDSKAAGERVEVPAIMATSKKLVVNSAVHSKGVGGTNILTINGGGKQGIVFSEHEELMSSVDNIEEISNSVNYDGEAGKHWTDNPEVIYNAAKMINDGEILRLKTIKADLEAQIKALEDINAANKTNLLGA